MRNHRLKRYIINGNIILYPTESCFGIVCDPSNFFSIQKIKKIKKRNLKKNFLLIGSNMQEFKKYIIEIKNKVRAHFNGFSLKDESYDKVTKGKNAIERFFNSSRCSIEKKDRDKIEKILILNPKKYYRDTPVTPWKRREDEERSASNEL